MEAMKTVHSADQAEEPVECPKSVDRAAEFGDTVILVNLETGAEVSLELHRTENPGSAITAILDAEAHAGDEIAISLQGTPVRHRVDAVHPPPPRKKQR